MPLTNLLGHRELLERLFRELERGRSQGFLFWGPKGVGKELVAEGLVLSLLCERRRRTGLLLHARPVSKSP